MATATRLESLLSLLASPPQQKVSAPAGDAQRRSNGGGAPHHCTTDQLALHVRQSGGANNAAEDLADSSAACAKPFGCASTSCWLHPEVSRLLSAADTQPAARHDTAAPASGAACGSAEHPPPGECSRPGGAAGEPVSGNSLVTASPPQPRGPDACAIPTARHRPPAAQQLFGCSNSGTGASSCCRTDAQAGAAPTDERECLQLRIAAANRRAQVPDFHSNRIIQ